VRERRTLRVERRPDHEVELAHAAHDAREPLASWRGRPRQRERRAAGVRPLAEPLGRERLDGEELAHLQVARAQRHARRDERLLVAGEDRAGERSARGRDQLGRVASAHLAGAGDERDRGDALAARELGGVEAQRRRVAELERRPELRRARHRADALGEAGHVRVEQPGRGVPRALEPRHRRPLEVALERAPLHRHHHQRGQRGHRRQREQQADEDGQSRTPHAPPPRSRARPALPHGRSPREQRGFRPAAARAEGSGGPPDAAARGRVAVAPRGVGSSRDAAGDPTAAPARLRGTP
jgi:hypothetical protein